MTTMTLINNKIKASKVRLIKADGSNAGIVSIQIALYEAQTNMLDLVEVSSGVNPPVCKIMDYGKFKFVEKKKQRSKDKGNNKLSVIKFRPNIGNHDFDVKLRKLKELLSKGNRCKVMVNFRRGEMRHTEIGFKLLDRISEGIIESAKIEDRSKGLEGKDISFTCTPNGRKEVINTIET